MAIALDKWGIPLTPDVIMARKAAEQIEALVEQGSKGGDTVFELKTHEGASIIMPISVGPLLLEMLRIIGSGNGLTVVPIHFPPTRESMEYARKRDAGLIE